MEIRKVETDKKRYLDLLLLADEQEDMIDRYLERGTMYVLEDDGVMAECVVTDEGDGVLELKNIADVYKRQAPDRAANYRCDGEGTRLNYEVVCQAVSAVRGRAPLDEHWKDAIEADLRKRHGRGR